MLPATAAADVHSDHLASREPEPLAAPARPSPNVAEVVLWVALVSLVALGLVAVGIRWLHPFDAATQMEPLRQRIIAALHGDGASTAWAADVARFDGQYRAHPLAMLAHIVPSGVFLALLPVQLSRPVRTRFPGLHRWTGRTLIVLGVVSGATALYFGLGMPFGGIGEAIVIALVAAWFFTSILRAWLSIRRGDVAHHREWMLRAVAVAIGVSVVRVVGAPTDLAFTPMGMSPRNVFVLALWLGWLLTAAVTEWWIRRTRPSLS